MEFRFFYRNMLFQFGNKAVAVFYFVTPGRNQSLDNVAQGEERNGAAKGLATYLWEPMGFIEYDMFVQREQRKVQSHICEEQRMVHQHQVGIHGAAFGSQCRALVVMGALFAQARFCGARQLGPKYAIAALAKGIALVHVTGFGSKHPRYNGHEGIPLVGKQKVLRCIQDFFELAQAQVIFAPLEYGRF